MKNYRWRFMTLYKRQWSRPSAPWAAAHPSLSITNSRSLLRLTSIESVMPSNQLILCRPLLLSSVFPSIRAFLMSQPFASSGQSVGASVSASNEYSGLSSFRINWWSVYCLSNGVITQINTEDINKWKRVNCSLSPWEILCSVTPVVCWEEHSLVWSSWIKK